MKLLIPDAILDSVFAINLAELKQRGISGLLIDIDNTLVPWGQAEMEQAFVDWVQKAKDQGFKVCLVSNAVPQRTESFAQLLDIPAVGRAMKPLSRAFRRGMKLLGLGPKEVAVVGDQLFTDVLGGNRLGLFTILINPLSTTELGATKIMRRLERRTLRKLAESGQISKKLLKLRQGRE